MNKKLSLLMGLFLVAFLTSCATPTGQLNTRRTTDIVHGTTYIHTVSMGRPSWGLRNNNLRVELQTRETGTHVTHTLVMAADRSHGNVTIATASRQPSRVNITRIAIVADGVVAVNSGVTLNAPRFSRSSNITTEHRVAQLSIILKQL